MSRPFKTPDLPDPDYPDNGRGRRSPRPQIRLDLPARTLDNQRKLSAAVLAINTDIVVKDNGTSQTVFCFTTDIALKIAELLK